MLPDFRDRVDGRSIVDLTEKMLLAGEHSNPGPCLAWSWRSFERP